MASKKVILTPELASQMLDAWGPPLKLVPLMMPLDATRAAYLVEWTRKYHERNRRAYLRAKAARLAGR